MKKSLTKSFFLGLLTAMFAVTNLHATTYTVAGDAAIVNGTTAWDATNTDNDMIDNGDGTYQLVITNCELRAGTIYKFKVVQDHDWNSGSWPSEDWVVNDYSFTETAIYTLTYTFIPSTGNVGFTATKTSDIWTVVGSATNSSTGGATDALFGTSWDPTASANDMTDNGDGTWTLTLRSKRLSAGTIAYKVAKGRAWTEAYPASNATLTVPSSSAGTWDIIFTFNTNTNTVSAKLAKGYAILKTSGGELTLFFYYGVPSGTAGTDYFETDNMGTNSVPGWTKYNGVPYANGKNIKKVIFDSSYSNARPISLFSWFHDFINITEIKGFSYLNTSRVETIEYTFYKCNKLKILDISNWDTSNIKNMGYTFYACYGLTSLDVSNWDTSNVEWMYYTFSYCNNVSLLDVSNWNTSKVKSLSHCFEECNKLTSLGISNVKNWDTSNVTSLENTFYRCSNLTELDVSKWRTSNVTTLSKTFQQCGIEKIDVGGWDTSNVTTLYHTFYGCRLYSLGDDNVKNWNTSKVTNMEGTFCSIENSIPELDVSNWDTSNVTTLAETFRGCSNLEKIDVSKWIVTNKMKFLNGTFLGCKKVPLLELNNWDTSNVTTMDETFGGCASLTSLACIENWNTSKVTNLRGTFSGCSGITSLDLSKWDTSNVTTMEGTFYKCSGLTSLNSIENWNTSEVTDLTNMFAYCNKLTLLNLNSWDTSKVNSLKSSFYYCAGLSSLNLKNWNTSNVTTMEETFCLCRNLTSLTFGKGFSMDNVTKYQYVFSSCEKLRYIDFYESNDTDAITSVVRNNNSSNMFWSVPLTTVIYLPHGSETVTDEKNVVYSYGGDENDLRCPLYYSEDKVDIEIPRPFKTNEAQYTRTMSKNYGSVILPYEFSSNEKIQAYTLDDEYTKQMFFKDAATVPAHTPFAFKKLSDDTTADFTMTDESQNFGITINATRSTHPDEISWDGQAGAPYTDAYGATESAVKLEGWTTKGYYVNQTFTPQDEGYSDLFYIASEKFYRANGETLTFPPHRVTFHGAWTKGVDGDAKTFDIVTEDDLPTLIEGIDADRNEYVNGEAEGIYDTAGRRLETLRKGVNIVRMNDGSVRKVFIK